jgi:hypothetical protein
MTYFVTFLFQKSVSRFTPSVGFPAAQTATLQTIHAESVLCIENLITFHQYIRQTEYATRNTQHESNVACCVFRSSAIICTFDNPSPLCAASYTFFPKQHLFIDEYIGQEHIVGEGKLLRRAIEADKLFSSIILWGPPGTGKTTLAQVIANTTKSHFVTLSAILAGKADLGW